MNFLTFSNNIANIAMAIVFIWGFIVISWSFFIVNKFFKMKRENRSFKKSLSDALALQLMEGGEREKIANEILQSLWLGHPLSHWFQCRACGRWRPFKKTGVNQKIIRDKNGKEIGHSNVVFCNDIKDCMKKAEHCHIGVNNEK